MICVNGCKECDGCMKCQEPTIVTYDEEGEPIYAGDEYYDFDGFIVAYYNIERYKKTAEEGGDE